MMPPKAEPAVRDTIHAPLENAAPPAVLAKLSALTSAPYADLKAEWRRLYRSPPPGRIGRDVLELAIAWKLQEQAFGGLSVARKRRLAELGATLAAKGDIAAARAVRLKPGARLVREWGGDTHDVLVLADGFEWRGKRWPSLTAIAVAITGARWSGPRFFGLAGRGESTTRANRVDGADENPASVSLGLPNDASTGRVTRRGTPPEAVGDRLESANA